MDIYNDLDRVLCVLAGRKFEECRTVEKALRASFQRRAAAYTASNQFCESEFFEIRFFKKGTIHLMWKDAKLREQFNETAARGKRWIGSNTQAA